MYKTNHKQFFPCPFLHFLLFFFSLKQIQIFTMCCKFIDQILFTQQIMQVFYFPFSGLIFT